MFIPFKSIDEYLEGVEENIEEVPSFYKTHKLLFIDREKQTIDAVHEELMQE